MHTVIVGGGFAGVKTALGLSKMQLGKITLISDEPYFLYHASLYATATGRDASASVVSLDDIFASHPDVEVVQDTMTSIDPQRRLVIGKKRQYPYDNVVVAIGVVTTYFDIHGMAAHSYGIKTLDEVKAFKKHLHDAIANDKHMDKNYVVIGGGLTGVELAGAMARYLREIAMAHSVKNPKVAITLVEAAPRIVPRLSDTASQKIQKRLEQLGVKVVTNHKVEALNSKEIIIEGKKMPTETAVWTSGVMNHPFFAKNDHYFRFAKNGRVKVDNYLQAFEDVHVIGDNADTPYTGTAKTALHDAAFMVDHLTRKATHRPLKRYKPVAYASSVPVGDDWAYIEKHGVYIMGRSGYFVRRLIELAGLKALLPRNQALNAWHAHFDRDDETCDLCKVV
jgi:NADH dehydrogenase